MEDQSVENALAKFAELQADDIGQSAQGGDRAKRETLAKFISDWHLVAFLGTTGLISPVSPIRLWAPALVHSCFEGMLINDAFSTQDDMRVLVRTATAPRLDDERVLDDLVRTEGWLTLMTFAREAARKF